MIVITHGIAGQIQSMMQSESCITNHQNQKYFKAILILNYVGYR